jgi:PIN domain nuclease of toxin-antitoxin system
MRYLLDTHCLLWAIFNPEKLSKSAREKIKDAENDISVSVVSFWEISLKYALRKLELTNSVPEDLPKITQKMGIEVLPINPHEAASFHKLPRLAHKDPFDRIIIWQAIQKKLTLISSDQEFRQYQQFGLKLN